MTDEHTLFPSGYVLDKVLSSHLLEGLDPNRDPSSLPHFHNFEGERAPEFYQGMMTMAATLLDLQERGCPPDVQEIFILEMILLADAMWNRYMDRMFDAVIKSSPQTPDQ